MRVVHIVTQTGTYGGERFVPSLARAQRACGIEASIATIYDSRDGACGVPVFSAGRDSRTDFFFRLAEHLRRSKPDIVHTHLAHGKVWGRMAAVASTRAPLVHTEHANDFGGSFAYRTLGRALNARTARIVAFSKAHAERIARLEHFARQRVAIVPNGIDFHEHKEAARADVRAALNVGNGARVVLFLGRLDTVKQPVRAVEAFALVPAQRNCVLRFAGDGRLRGDVVARARELGVSDRVALLGYRDDVGRLLAGADVVVNTSSTEAMPLSIVEALCAGVPVVSTPWPGADELLSASGIVSESHEPASIAAAIESALHTPRLAPGPLLDEIRERFSIARTAREHQRLYDSLLA